jgi:hypothetical protein
MYRTVVFISTFPNEWTFDENDNPLAPGARQLADTIAAKLLSQVVSVSEVHQHEYYGWEFDVLTENGTFVHVLNPGDRCYLTISMRWHWLKAILLKQPRQVFERYCEFLTETLQFIPEISRIEWDDFR